MLRTNTYELCPRTTPGSTSLLGLPASGDGGVLSVVQTVQATATTGTDTTAPMTPARTVPEATARATASGCRLTARLITIG